MFKLILTIFFISSVIDAQNQSYSNSQADNDTISNYYLFEYIDSLTPEDYELMLDSIKNGLSDDFFTLRMAYTKTEFYSPYDTEIGDEHKRIRDYINESNYSKALTITDSVLFKNYVDINSHLYRGFIYYQLADSTKSDFHYDIYNGLLESIYMSGDGNTPRTAYLVINTKEEYNFLDWFNLIPDQQELITEDNFAFDLIHTTQQENNQKFDVYFNITMAINHLSKNLEKD